MCRFIEHCISNISLCNYESRKTVPFKNDNFRDSCVLRTDFLSDFLRLGGAFSEKRVPPHRTTFLQNCHSFSKVIEIQLFLKGGGNTVKETSFSVRKWLHSSISNDGAPIRSHQVTKKTTSIYYFILLLNEKLLLCVIVNLLKHERQPIIQLFHRACRWIPEIFPLMSQENILFHE